MTKILLVEDHPELRHILQRQLEWMGFTAIAATNGKNRVDKAVAEKPNFDHDELYHARDGRLGSNPGSAGKSSDEGHSDSGVDGNAPASHLRAWIDVGCNDYILKPFTSDELLKKIYGLNSVQCVARAGKWPLGARKRLETNLGLGWLSGGMGGRG